MLSLLCVKDGSGNPFMKQSAIKDCSIQPDLVLVLIEVIYKIVVEQGYAKKINCIKNRLVFTNRFVL